MTGAGHVLDRPVWSAFSGPQAALARRNGKALRVMPEVGLFAATADLSAESLADLPPLVDADGVGLVEAEDVDLPLPPGLVVLRSAPCDQMVAERLAAAPPPVEHRLLGPDDARAMLALATLTEPGPFRLRTLDFGGFIGIERGGELVAMAGERMRPPGHAEVSGVCTHPDHRGRGHAAALMHAVAARILARGETPFLHAYSANRGVIALYERLGFRLRRRLALTVVGARS